MPSAYLSNMQLLKLRKITIEIVAKLTHCGAYLFTQIKSILWKISSHFHSISD